MTGTATFVIAGLLVLAGTYSQHLGQLSAQPPAASAAAAPSTVKTLTRAGFDALREPASN